VTTMWEKLPLTVAGWSWGDQPVFMLFFLAGEWIHLLLGCALAAASAILTLPAGAGFLARVDRDPLFRDRMERGLAIGVFALLSWYLLLRGFQYVGLGGYETALMHLFSIWNNSRHLFLPDFYVPGHTHIGDHFEPITALYSPVAWLSGSPALIVLINGALASLSVALMNRILKAQACETALRWTLIAVFLANFYFQTVLHFFFSISALAMPAFLLVIWLWEQRKTAPALLAVVLFLCVKEEAGLALASFAFGSLVVGRSWDERRRNGALLLLSIAGFLGSMAVIRLYAAPFDAAYDRWHVFLGRDMPQGGVFSVYLRAPFALIHAWVWPPAKFRTFAALIASTGGVALFNPAGLLALAAANFPHQIALVDQPYHTYADYYSAFILPILFWASGGGAMFLYRRFSARHRLHLLAALLMVAAVNLMKAPLPARYYNRPVDRYRHAWQAILEVRRHPEASVVCSPYFCYPLAFRSHLGLLPYTQMVPDYALINQQDHEMGRTALFQAAVLDRVPYKAVILHRDVTLFKRD
jgi:uncharacterized membrane protein